MYTFELFLILIICLILILWNFKKNRKETFENYTPNPLIVVLSCLKNRHLWENLLKINENIIIFCGDPNLDSEYELKDRILYLKCEDTYDHLPTKVFSMIKAILKIKEFKKYTHIFKIDDHDTSFDSNTISKLKKVLSTNIDYGGQLIIFGNGARNWHFGKCPKNSIWNNKLYEGEYTNWVEGGNGYFLSRKSMSKIVSTYPKIEDIYQEHIYEDLMIGLILQKYNIKPEKIEKIIIGDK